MDNTNNNLNELKKSIEIDSEKKVKELKETSHATQENLIDIMKTSTDNFKEKTGRNITYAEIREMFG